MASCAVSIARVASASHVTEQRGGPYSLVDGAITWPALALHAVDPSLVILPAHDREAWRGIFGAPSRCLPPR